MIEAKRFRKRPVVIEAFQWFPAMGETGPVVLTTMDTPLGRTEEFTIRTLEGLTIVTPGDFIIRGVAGEFYPCKPDIFEQTYELVGE